MVSEVSHGTESFEEQLEREGYELDPFFLHTRKEACIIFSVWVVAFLWTVPVSYALGFPKDPSVELPVILGIPRWLFLGVLTPWSIAVLFTLWFCSSVMKDADLEHLGQIEEQTDSLSEQNHHRKGEQE